MAQKRADSRARLIASISRQARERCAEADRGHIDEFIAQYYRIVSEQDMRGARSVDLAGSAASHLEFARERQPGTPLVRILNPTTRRDGWRSTHTVMQVVTDDMPFLVDSLGMVMNRHSHSLHLTIHPVMQVHRDEDGLLQELLPRTEASDEAIAESFMHIEIDRETDEAELEAIREDALAVLSDVRAAVNDWQGMRRQALDVCGTLAEAPEGIPAREITEVRAFLEWMESGHFTFLGYRQYDLTRERGKDKLVPRLDSGLGILRERPERSSRGGVVLPRDVSKRAKLRELLIVTKANSQSTIHRPALLDYVGVKVFDEAGEVIGERRFLGLFTSVAYSRSPRDIPLLRHKVQQVMRLSGLHPAGHAGKALMHILETFPRDELFQSSVPELSSITTGILALQERQQVRLFIRRDAFGRFFSCLVYVPRDKYHTKIRERIQGILMEALAGLTVESSVQLSESALARAHIIVHTTPWKFARYDIDDLEARISEAVRTWTDQLRDELVERYGEEFGLKLYRRYAESFPPAYVDEISPRAAAFDVDKIEELAGDVDALAMSLYRPARYTDRNLRFKLFRAEYPIPLTDALPMLENMGLRVIAEQPYKFEMRDESIVWLQDFEMLHTVGESLDPEAVSEVFQDCFEAVYRGLAEQDSFNKLVLHAGLGWREVALIRAYCKYLLQAGVPFSQAYMEQAVTRNANIAGLLVQLFRARFDPSLSAKKRERESLSTAQAIDDALEQVESLDEDRILRSFLDLIRATLRTNYYQTDEHGELREHMSFKLDPERIPDLPLPRPMFEIWVYSPRVEAVHLRGGKVARGGLRWSDRREDFRTEVLGLMKAQQVKNAVIVPVGSKGGFVVKRLPAGDREVVMREVQHCYRSFIRGMLDITDNLDGDSVVPPEQVVRHDDDDPYLVVAADKGTATFSDMANEVAAEYGYWLGDAFASGGSAGYDHKGMGITAKGAWESVKRHFREFGIDTQSQDFTVVGIGDMLGDVFGNGMLLSRHIRLRAAFNHMHIFLDPEPDAEASYRERERMFRLPRSTWEDYDAELISKGGGVFSRSAKSIRLSAEVKRMLEVDATSLAPNELIRAILRMKVDLIWNGGIGTYIKASDESHAEVGDRANDALRVDAPEVQARVIGEGGNLGVTQKGRVEYALNGGRVNTDFIDNAGGVDCSDHEVNIKILLNLVMADRRFSKKQRDKLLQEMTDEVTALVLRSNYGQTQALSMMEAQSEDRLNEFAYLITVLERRGGLNRALEFLPSADEIEERARGGMGLTRPELSVILSYAKMNLFEVLTDSDIVDDSYLQRVLAAYFPKPLRRRYRELMSQHRLRREIIATVVTNDLINRMGPTFAYRMHEETGADGAAITRAYTIAVESLGLRELWRAIQNLDNKAPASVQYSMMVQSSRLLKHVTRWVLSHLGRSSDIAEAVASLAPGIATVTERMDDFLLDEDLEHFQAACAQYAELGIPLEVARRVAGLKFMYAAADIVGIAQETSTDVAFVGGVYFRLGAGMVLNWSRDHIERLKVDGHWQAVARGTLRENLYALHRELATGVIDASGRRSDSDVVVRDWLQEHADEVEHSRQMLADMASGGDLDFATMSVALQEIRKLSLIASSA